MYCAALCGDGRKVEEGESRKVEEHADGTGDALYLYRPELEARELINARNDVHHNKDLLLYSSFCKFSLLPGWWGILSSAFLFLSGHR